MVERRRKTSLGEQAYGKLRDLIITLDLKPGSQINESGLERDLAIGRTPVREALLRLVSEGFLTSVAGRGFFVREVTLEDVRALFEAAMILERGGIALAARRISDIEIRRMKEIHLSLKKAMSDKNYLQVTLLNSHFHRIIHEASRNHFMISSFYYLDSQYHRLAYLCFSEEVASDDLKVHFEKVIVDHDQLLDSLKKRDEKTAIDTITRHIRLFHARVTRYLLPPMGAIEAACGAFAINK